MISGRADCSDDWLPARIRPVRGESFDSLCRRLAAANGITPAVLMPRGACDHRGQAPAGRLARQPGKRRCDLSSSPSYAHDGRVDPHDAWRRHHATRHPGTAREPGPGPNRAGEGQSVSSRRTPHRPDAVDQVSVTGTVAAARRG